MISLAADVCVYELLCLCVCVHQCVTLMRGRIKCIRRTIYKVILCKYEECVGKEQYWRMQKYFSEFWLACEKNMMMTAKVACLTLTDHSLYFLVSEMSG